MSAPTHDALIAEALAAVGAVRVNGAFPAEVAVQRLADAVAQQRDTITRLNRRCQSAEKGLQAKLDSPLIEGRTFGRIFANSAATMYAEQLRDCQAALAAAQRDAARVEAALVARHEMLLSCWHQWAYDNPDGSWTDGGLSTLEDLGEYLVGAGALRRINPHRYAWADAAAPSTGERA